MINVSVNKSSPFNNSFVRFKSNPAKSKTVTTSHIQTALSVIQGLRLRVEICGSWMWVFGADASHETQLRSANFKWSYRRGYWYLSPQVKDTKIKDNSVPPAYQLWCMNKVRKVFGSQVVQL